MCTFVMRIIPPSGQVIPALPPLLPSRPCFRGSLGERDHVPAGRKQHRAGAGGEKKAKKNETGCSHFTTDNERSRRMGKSGVSQDLYIFFFTKPYFPRTDPRPNELLDAE